METCEAFRQLLQRVEQLATDNARLNDQIHEERQRTYDAKRKSWDFDKTKQHLDAALAELNRLKTKHPKLVCMPPKPDDDIPF